MYISEFKTDLAEILNETNVLFLNKKYRIRLTSGYSTHRC